MNKKVNIELTQEEYDALVKMWEQAKASPVMPSKALNFDDFCKEVLVMLSKGPDMGEFKNMNLEDLMSSMGDLSQIKDMLDGLKSNKKEPKKEDKKDEVPDDQKYKS